MSNIFLNKILFAVEIIIAEILCTCHLKKRSRFALRLAAYMVVVLAVSVVFPSEINNFVYSCFMFFTLFAVSVLMMAFCYQEPAVNIISCGLAAYTVQHAAYELSNLVLVLCIRNSLPIFDMYDSAAIIFSELSEEQIIYALIYLLCFYVCYGAFYMVFGRQIKKTGTIEIKSRITLFLVALGLIVDIVLNAGYVYNSEGTEFVPGLIIYASNCLCCFLLLFVQYGQIRQKKLENELAFTKQLWEQNKKQYELFKDNMELFNIRCHDMKHQIRGIGRDKGLPGEALDEIEKQITFHDLMIKTGNEILDTILTEKNLRCNKNEIVFTCVADGKKLGFISDSDIYALFGNALDNAIEAAIKIEEPEKRMIGLSVRSVHKFTLIEIINTFSGDICAVDGVIQTTKKDGGLHGYGLKSINLIAEKYGGNMTFSVEGDVFSLNILIPSPDENIHE